MRKPRTSFGGATLPESFELAWTRQAQQREVPDDFTVQHVEQRFGLWTITVKANGKVVGVRKAEDIERAAVELFNQAFPP